MGGNDIALIKKSPGEKSPSDTQIIEAIKETARKIHNYNIIPIIVPILPRTNTKYHKTNITPEEYQRRATKINKALEKELTEELGYNPMSSKIDQKRSLEDEIHLTYDEYKNITSDILKKTEEIRELKKSTRQRRAREREESREEHKQEERRLKERQEDRNRRMQSRSEIKAKEEIANLTSKARNWRIRMEKHTERQERIDEGFRQLDEENKRKRESTPKDKNEKILQLATNMKNILAPIDNKTTQTDNNTELITVSTQTPSILEILPQLLDDLKICITKAQNKH